MRNSYFHNNIDRNALAVAQAVTSRFARKSEQCPDYALAAKHSLFNKVNEMSLRQLCKFQVEFYDECASESDEALFEWMSFILWCIDPVFYE